MIHETSLRILFLYLYFPGPTDSSQFIDFSADPTLLRDQAIVMALASAILGPLLDNQHSMYGVLTYAHPITITLPRLLTVETTWWTPLLFGLAGIIIGVGTPALDTLASSSTSSEPTTNIIDKDGDKEDRSLLWKGEQGSVHSMEPSWSWVCLGISAFVLQYWLSAILDSSWYSVNVPGTAVPAVDAVLALAALATWGVFDFTLQGFFMAVLTGISGPVVEIGLISQDLYHYTHQQIFDSVPTWIAWTYFAGGPAVGNLGRKTAAILQRKRQEKLLRE